jgi:PPOX class probable F420-dependent enzyme
VDFGTAREFIRANHRAVLATTRADGRPQLSPVTAAVDDEGRVIISTRETAVKVKHLAKDPHAALCVLNDRFFGEWVAVEGPAEIVHLPEAMDILISYYRSVSGEHPDWDDYRAAMVRDQRCIVRITLTRAGPDYHG